MKAGYFVSGRVKDNCFAAVLFLEKTEVARSLFLCVKIHHPLKSMKENLVCCPASDLSKEYNIIQT